MAVLTRSVCATVLLASGALGHDFWIEPSTYRAEAGATVALHLRVGMQFEGEEVARDPKLTRRFFAIGPDGGHAVSGEDGASPAGTLTLLAPGIYVIGYRSNRKFIEIEPKLFHEYLEEEGLADIIERRRKLGEADKPGREWYSRCAKLLVAVDSGGEGFDRRLGFELELVPEKNPYTLKPGDALPVRLLFRGEPLAGALIEAETKGRPEAKQQVRTDSDGRAVLRFPVAGPWLLAVVHMERTAEGSEADWESWWGSLVFELPQHR